MRSLWNHADKFVKKRKSATKIYEANRVVRLDSHKDKTLEI